MKKLLIGFVLGLLLISSIAYAASRDGIVMALDLIKEQQSIITQARMNAKNLITTIDWLKAQYEDAEKKAEINEGLTNLGVDGVKLKTELNAVRDLMQDVLDNTIEPKSLR